MNPSVENQKSKGLRPFVRASWMQYLLIFALFALISIVYFAPASWEGRKLFQQDVAGVSGNGSDVQASGKTSYWTNSLFSGMPMYQISPSYPSTQPMQKIMDFITLRKLPLAHDYGWLLFSLMAGFFLFLVSLGVKKWQAMIGALMWAFSSYFVILIAAGHIWKLMALCFIPPTIAGLIWIYRGYYLKGGAVMAFFAGMQILSNHVQMSYYFLFVMLAFVFGFFVDALQKKNLRLFFRSTVVTIVAGLVGVAINATNLYHTYKYSQHTMRGGSELTLPIPEQEAEEAEAEINPSGLSKEYITQWSYGIGETWSLLIPNVKGGASGSMAEKHPEEWANSDPAYREHLAMLSSYWGNQPFTSGPVYVGAFVFFLFWIGVFMLRSPYKWVLFGVTLFSITLSWGHNMMWLTNLFIDYVPMYDKFRAVSSILVIAEFAIPALAILTAIEWQNHPERFPLKKIFWVAGSLLALMLLMALMPSLFFSFTSRQEKEFFVQASLGQPEYLSLWESLKSLRISIFRADLLRSAIVIGLSCVPMILFYKKRLPAPWMWALVSVITLVDMWVVDKRYLYDDMFLPSHKVTSMASPKTPADELILKDESLGYRVLNLTVDPFNDATTSRWHRSVGGYHAAKLQRYQDLIDHQLYRLNPSVINMLNTRYLITQGEDGKPQVELNEDAFGAAWFAPRVLWVESANEEMQALDSTDLKTTAVVDTRFRSLLSILPSASDSLAYISVEKYEPSELVYRSFSQSGGLAVFSEIYYPEGWKMYIDGEEKPILRANYLLRAAEIPRGEHTIRFVFDPDSLHTTERIAWVALGLCLGLLLLSCGVPLCKRYFARKKQ